MFYTVGTPHKHAKEITVNASIVLQPIFTFKKNYPNVHI